MADARGASITVLVTCTTCHRFKVGNGLGEPCLCHLNEEQKTRYWKWVAELHRARERERQRRDEIEWERAEAISYGDDW